MACTEPSLFSLPFTHLNKEIIEDKLPTPVSTHPKNISLKDYHSEIEASEITSTRDWWLNSKLR